MAQIDQFLEEILRRRGSDLHFLAGDPPRIRLHGELSPLRPDPLTAEFVKETLYEIMPKKAQERFEQKDGADFEADMLLRLGKPIRLEREMTSVEIAAALTGNTSP